MQSEAITSNGSAEKTAFHGYLSEFNGGNVDGVITYKRRKYARPCTEGNLLEDGDISGTADRLNSQTTKEPCNMILHNNANEEEGLVRYRLEHPILLKCANDFPSGYWKNVLEYILQSLDVTEDGIQSCILDALAPAQGKDPIRRFKDNRHKGHSQLPRESKNSCCCWDVTMGQEGITSDVYQIQKVPDDETTGRTITKCCQSVFLDIIISETFVSFCNLLCENFKGIKADSIFNFSLINSRMSSRQYEQSPELFASDVQQEWSRFEKIGVEMIHLAKSISNIAQNSFLNQLGDLMYGDIGEWRHLEINQVGTKQNDYRDLDTSNHLPSNQLGLYTKPEQTEACGLCNVCTCRECGVEADGKRRLICDWRDAMYHVSCIEPAIEEIPISWYFDACSTDGKFLSEPESTQIQGEFPHLNYVVCERCKDPEIQIYGSNKEMTRIFNNLELTLDCSMKPDGLQVSRGSRSSLLCKLCKMGEEDGQKMLVCGNPHCPDKYYHQRCLRVKQLTCPFSQWYCPSCLCRACLFDKDDDKIVLCDGCDEAYHIYCIVPPRTSIPRGKWYCMFCTIVIRARRKMMMRNESVVKKQKRNNTRRGNGASGSMDLLLIAAETLNFEGKSAARRKNR